MQNFYELSSAAQTAAYQLSELSNYVSEAAKMADSVRMVSNQMKSIYQTAEWNNMAYRLAKDARLCVPEYQLSNLAKNLAGQARADLNFTNQISALYGSAMESPAFRLSTEMLNSNVLNLTTALRTSNITNLYSNAAAFADQLDSIWSESTYSEKESETVPLASTQAVLDEVEPLLPTEAVETINAQKLRIMQSPKKTGLELSASSLQFFCFWQVRHCPANMTKRKNLHGLQRQNINRKCSKYSERKQKGQKTSDSARRSISKSLRIRMSESPRLWRCSPTRALNWMIEVKVSSIRMILKVMQRIKIPYRPLSRNKPMLRIDLLRLSS